ncbi:RDD family protein [Streptomyces piniterrae]|uniref:RDD family protein n=1 Tax=Streptomyces piniterrae TaxID=2571125 RepID=A0A4U0NEF8_9ACTN|nr:RDD family protein [Streptomyces piniterrae]TJZ51942.1 RDD family protein [Streptomyces piniterrae]
MSGFPPPQGEFGPPPAPAYAYPPQVSGPSEQMLANQGARLGARLLDILFVFVLMAVVAGGSALVHAMAPGSEALGVITGVIAIISLVVLVFHEPFMNWKFGGTLGKQICGLRVARLEDGRNISLGRAFGRFLVVFPMGFVPFLSLLNLLWCCWDKPYRQCLHDKAATTVVVKRAP